jgi:alkaline phosphatase D
VVTATVVVTVSNTAFDTEFGCIRRALERAPTDDSGPLFYRVRHNTKLWRSGETPPLEQQIVEGDPRFSI